MTQESLSAPGTVLPIPRSPSAGLPATTFPPRRRPYALALAGFVAASAIGVMLGTENYWATLGHPEQKPWLTWVLLELPVWYVWLALSPLAFWFARRFPVRGRRRWRNLALHLPLGGAFLVLVMAGIMVVKTPLIPEAPRDAASMLRLGWSEYLRTLGWVFPFYGLLISVAHAVDAYRDSHRRAMRGVRLQAMLERAQRDLLRMQLQPHFLFNTLHAVSALMARDVPSARRMIARLSDLLRLALDDDARHEVTLEEEVEFLERYAAIQKIRFGGRLGVEYEIDAAARRLLVPRLVLQPLVENAITHGLSRLERGGCVTVRATTDGRRLAVRVLDDGRGLDPDGARREGVGLGNTRARLAQLYGPDAALVLADRPEGGCEARIDLPASTMERALGPEAGPPEDADDAAIEWHLPLRPEAEPAHDARGAGAGWAAAGPYVGAFIVATLLAAERTTASMRAGPRPTGWNPTWIELFPYNLANWYPWLLAVPAVFWLARRLPVHGPRAWRNLALHVPISAAVFMLASFVAAALKYPASQARLPAGMTLWGLVGATYRTSFAIYLPLYFVILGVAHAVHAEREARRRALREARLHGLLERARRDALRMQLQPHFLFNTLHAVSALMDRDVLAARRMIARLSELLRVALDDDARHEVPLEEEIDFLDRYAEIQKIRFGGRLSVDYDVAADARRVKVPRLVLQPLVENAITHGLARLERPGTVTVEARRDGDRLVLRVLDDGEGLPEGGVRREGVGLGNTRARLEQLYGAAGRMDVLPREGGGCEVRIELPAAEEEATIEAEEPRTLEMVEG
jgi:LytS/YehU family sensor histidine kinase